MPQLKCVEYELGSRNHAKVQNTGYTTLVDAAVTHSPHLGNCC
jgi:hypothetical protein